MLTRVLAIFGIIALLAPPVLAAPDGKALQAALATGATGGWVNTTRPLTAQDFKGRLVLLDFWTYGCINCMQIIPDLDYLEQKFPQLLVIGVHSAKYTGEGLSDRIRQAADRFGIHHPVMNDNDYKIWDLFGVRAWPTLVLLDGEGREISRYSGEGHRDALEKDIAQALASGSAAADLKDIVDKRDADGILSYPSHLVYAPETPMGPLLFISDTSHHRILGATPDGKIRLTIGSGTAGWKDGDAKTAQFRRPRGVTVAHGVLYVADTENHAVRAVDLASGAVTTLVGTGTRGYDRTPGGAGKAVALASPWDVELLADGKTLAIANAGTHQLWQYDLGSGLVVGLAGTGGEDITDGRALSAELAQPSGLSRAGDALYFVDAESSSLRKLQNGEVKTLIGTGLFDFGRLDGAYPKASLQHPQGIFADSGKIYVADTYNNALRVYDTATAKLSTFKLQGLTLNEPGDVTVAEETAYLTDTGNSRIVRVDLATGAAAEIPLAP